METFDAIHKTATIIIAGCSLYVSFYIFRQNKNNQANDKQKDRNIQSLKVLVLDHSLKFLYTFFEDLNLELQKLKAPDLDDEKKANIVDKVSDKFIEVRMKFVDMLLAVDDKLYNEILSKMDNFQSHISNSAFDGGINLFNSTKYDELISVKYNVFKTEIIKSLFAYKG
ncbi:hypothetical protein [Pedobacter miscanthi]|uniref:hypothetical protein n=1 Tax=Pedobacter miscanthi TaxID=2259170 RepID=UPI0029317F8B|nr:hypothetical protein [Pedobacter miscanthi]